MYISEANKCYACYGDSVKWDDAVEWGVLVKEVAAVVYLLLKRG